MSRVRPRASRTCRCVVELSVAPDDIIANAVCKLNGENTKLDVNESSFTDWRRIKYIDNDRFLGLFMLSDMQ